MKCPKCNAEMIKAKKADVWLCPDCGARARVRVDVDPETSPAVTITIPPRDYSWPTAVYYGCQVVEDPFWKRFLPQTWCATTTNDAIPGLPVNTAEVTP